MAEAIRLAVRHRPDVIDISPATASQTGGHPCDPQRQAAIDYALENDIVVVAGAGNDRDADNAWMRPAVPECSPSIR